MWNGTVAENRKIRGKVCLPFQEDRASGTFKNLGHFQRREMEEMQKTSIMSRAVKRTERFTAHRTTFESCFSHYNDLIRAQKHLFSSPKHHLCLMLFYCPPQKKVVQVWKIFLKMWGWQLKSVGCCFGPHWPSFYRQKQFNKSSFVFHRRKSVMKN